MQLYGEQKQLKALREIRKRGEEHIQLWGKQINEVLMVSKSTAVGGCMCLDVSRYSIKTIQFVDRVWGELWENNIKDYKM